MAATRSKVVVLNLNEMAPKLNQVPGNDYRASAQRPCLGMRREAHF